MTTQSLYEKSLRSYLLTKYTSAANTCLKAISSLQKESVDDNLQLNVWTLYLNIASTLLVGHSISTINTKLLGISPEKSIEQVTRSIWNKIVQEGFSANPGSVDSRIVSSCMVMNLKLNQVNVAKDIAEEWFAGIPDTVLDHITINQEKDQLGLGYKEVVQIYTTRVLTALNDYESANTFLEYNSILNDDQKKSLQYFIEEQKESIEKEKQKKKQLEQEAKLAAEKKKKEQEEKLRIEEEKKRMEEEQNRQKEELARKLKEQEQQHEIKEQPSPVSEPIVAAPRSVKPQQRQQNSVVQKWLNQVSAKGVATSGAVLILIFALFALLRGQRGRLSVALQSLMNKLWQTVKMGTKVTYI